MVHWLMVHGIRLGLSIRIYRIAKGVDAHCDVRYELVGIMYLTNSWKVGGCACCQTSDQGSASTNQIAQCLFKSDMV